MTAALAMAWLAILLIAFVQHRWILDGKNNPLVTDFLEVWVAGKSVLKGAAAAPYDWKLHHIAQIAAVGHPFNGYLGWLYPPVFLLFAAALAMLPYLWALLFWVAGTCAFYLPVIARIARARWAAVVALASPAALGNVLAGQNGFLSGALIGASLLLLETQPAIAGIFVGLLTYKPQLGLLFPIALLAGRQWKCLASATATAALCLLIPYLLFGSAPFVAFFRFMPTTESTVLAHGLADWNKLQTVYGLTKSIGGSTALAWQMQAIAALLAACSVAWLWNAPNVSHALKAAALSASILATTPYLYPYDLPILAVPLAFLFRDRKFDGVEWSCFVILALCLLCYFIKMLPLGPVLLAIMGGMIFRRTRRTGSAAREREMLSSGPNRNLSQHA